MGKIKFMMLAFIAMLATCTIALSACGDDKDEPENNSIYGQWEVTNYDEAFPDHAPFITRLVLEITSIGEVYEYSYAKDNGKWIKRVYSGIIVTAIDETQGSINGDEDFADEYSLLVYHSLTKNSVIFHKTSMPGADMKMKATKGIKGDINYTDM